MSLMDAEELNSLLPLVTAIGSVVTPVLVLILSGIGWVIGNRFSKTREIEEKLREDRIKIYNDVLEPFIMVFVKDDLIHKPKGFHAKNNADAAGEKMQSLEYKQTVFRVSLMGSDDVVRALNNLMQFFYSGKLSQDNIEAAEKEQNTKEFLSLLGKMLLEIRKSVGNDSSKLHHLEMLEFLITDIRKFQINGKYQ